MRGNGERIGPQNLPTSSIAGGIWNLLNQQRAQQRGAWPSATPAVVTDPYFMYVPLLLNTTSTNAQQNNTFLDSSSNAFTITRNGTPTQGAFTPYQPSGYWSGYFGGTSQYLNISNSSALQLTNATAFTIECWVYFTSLSAITYLFSNYNFSSPYQGYGLRVNTTGGNFEFWDGTNWNSFSYVAQANAWTHVAVSYEGSGTTRRFFVNGVQQGSAGTVPSSINYTSGTLNIGGQTSATSSLYLSNVRIVKGTALYTSAFTPSTTPLSAITNTSLLTLQSNRFVDNSASPLTITTTGSPLVQAFQPFAPAASYSAATYGGSGYFSGSTSEYLTVASNAAFQITGSYTIEAWVYATSINTFQNILSQYQNSTNAFACGYNSTSGWYFNYRNNAAEVTNYRAGASPLNVWTHVAFVKSSTTMTIYINGVALSSTITVPDLPLFSSALYIGIWAAVPDSPWTGYISNVRLVKGTAIYTANFTPPTTPVTAVSGTSLLTNFTNAGIYDAAWQNNALTVGDAQSSTTQYKWSPTSMKFDGTGDWLTAIDSPGLQLGSGDFTIEGWFYLSATGAIYGIVSKGTATTGWSVNVTVLNKLQFSYTASNLTGATSLSASTWYYFAVVRSGTATGNLKVYLNGSADATSGGAVTDNFNQTSTFYTGADRIGGSALNGYLQDIRLTKGYARTITTPTAAFPTR